MKTLLLAIFLSIGGVGKVRAETLSLDQWVREQKPRAAAYLQKAISPNGAARGSVYASPSRFDPDYYYHWVRDAALIMREILEIRSSSPRTADRMLRDFAAFSRQNQLTPNPSGTPNDRGLGEPKFNMDGSAYMASWGRPQNDGPALRAFLLADYALALWSEGEKDYVRNTLYRAEIPATSVLKADLEYVAHHWRESSFDLWEESAGDHFYTRMSQWRALEKGAVLARLLDDGGAASYYASEAAKVLRSLEDFWSDRQQIIRATLHRTGGIDYKNSGLDVAVILAVNQLGKSDGPFSVRDERVQKTALALEDAFARLYPVNRNRRTAEGEELAPGIGRYPEDRYDGYGVERLGNPWFLATQGMAEFYYRLSAETVRDPRFSQSIRKLSTFARLAKGIRAELTAGSRLAQRGDAFLRRAQFHSEAQGRQAEQFHRDSGIAQGARDLTWSYASFLSAVRARAQLINEFKTSRFESRSQPFRSRRK